MIVQYYSYACFYVSQLYIVPPLFFFEFILSGKKYTILDGVSLLCMSIGLIMFTLADSSVQPNFDMAGKEGLPKFCVLGCMLCDEWIFWNIAILWSVHVGVLLISLALCADAVIGNVQEKTLKQYSASNVELVLYSYFVGVFYILLGVLLSGSLIPAFQFCLKVSSFMHIRIDRVSFPLHVQYYEVWMYYVGFSIRTYSPWLCIHFHVTVNT